MTTTQFYIMFGINILLFLIATWFFYTIHKLNSHFHRYENEISAINREAIKTLEHSIMRVHDKTSQYGQYKIDQMVEQIEAEIKDLKRINSSIYNNINSFSNNVRYEIDQNAEIKKLHSIIAKKNKQIKRLKDVN